MVSYFQPWIGANYSTGGIFDIPILVLGKSIYEWTEDEQLAPNRIVELIESNITEGGKTYPFHTNIFLAFTRQECTVENKRNFWNSVAFFNYIIKPVQGGPRVAPDNHMIEEGKAAFLTRLGGMSPPPACIVVLGAKLWFDYLPKEGVIESNIYIDGQLEPHETRIYHVGLGRDALASWVNDPAAGFSSISWYPIIQAIISAAKDRNESMLVHQG